jgi:hypothetical protein
MYMTKEEFAAEEILKLTQLLEDMYGRLGVGAVYDTMRDWAERLSKVHQH